MKVYRKIAGHPVNSPAFRSGKQSVGLNIPIGTIIYRWETITKIQLVFGFLRNDLDELRQFCDGFELTNPNDVTWFYVEENKPNFSAEWELIGSYPDGDAGPQGVQGTLGLDGTQGTQGTLGLDGTQGTQGTLGLDGTQGTQGTLGLDGTQGVQGTGGVTGAFSGTLDQNLNCADYAVIAPNLQDIGEIVNPLGNCTGAITVDLTQGNIVTGTTTGITTWTWSNPTATGHGCTFTLILTNGGAFTQNWPVVVDWPSGVGPTLTVSGVDILVFNTIDAGTTWRGVLSGLDFK